MDKKNTATDTMTDLMNQHDINKALEAQRGTGAVPAASAELIPLTALPIVEYTTKAGETRQAVRLHSVSFLPEKIGEDGKVQSARFGGFLSEMTDPATGEIRGLDRDSVALQFFGHAAEELRSILGHLEDPKRDAILLAVNGDPAQLFASVHRDATGKMRQLAVGTREFRGNFKRLVAAPPAVVEAE